MADRWGLPRNPALRRQAQRAIPRACAGCGSRDHLELDHIIPLAEGGADNLGNVQWLCPTCHRPKSQREATRGKRRFHAQRHREPEAHPGRVP